MSYIGGPRDTPNMLQIVYIYLRARVKKKTAEMGLLTKVQIPHPAPENGLGRNDPILGVPQKGPFLTPFDGILGDLDLK